MRVLVTGAAGRIGRLLRPRLARPGRVLRLLDNEPLHPSTVDAHEELIAADLTDAGAIAAACAGVDAVVHLGAISTESPWPDILRVNIDGTRTVLAAARAAGVGRVVLASSIHAVGFHAREPGAEDLPADIPARPDTYYGVSKAALESLGSLYADRFGMTVIALRIGACFEQPVASLYDAWLSPDDCARLMEACLTTDLPGYRTVWGISRNRRRWWSLAAGEEIGYFPKDDADEYAIATGHTEDSQDRRLVGGHFVDLPLGVRPN
jgi:nucleoside-diphosphate-sugar epimerase